MYFTITFDILTTIQDKKAAVKQFFKDCLTGLPWVKPLSNMYIVSCDDERIRRAIFQKIIDFSIEHKGEFRFLMTPLIDTGQITGITARELWPHIKRYTQSDDSNNTPFL